MIGRLVTLALIAGGVYLLLTRALPWLQGDLRPAASESAGSDEGSFDCVRQASQVSSSLAQAMRRFSSPPVDENAWSDTVWDLESQIQSASSECHCATEACSKATAALDELQSLLAEYDSMVRGDVSGWGNPARRRERFLDMLTEARSAAGL